MGIWVNGLAWERVDVLKRDEWVVLSGVLECGFAVSAFVEVDEDDEDRNEDYQAAPNYGEVFPVLL